MQTNVKGCGIAVTGGVSVDKTQYSLIPCESGMSTHGKQKPLKAGDFPRMSLKGKPGFQIAEYSSVSRQKNLEPAGIDASTSITSW